MGMFDNIRNIFKRNSSKDTPMAQKSDSYEKSILAEQIVDSINKIKRVNSFDSSLWNLSNATIYNLQGRTLQELEEIQYRLNNRLSELSRQSQMGNQSRESLEASKWTGRAPAGMTNHDFDRFQNDDGR